MNDYGLGWRLSWADYRGWRTKDLKEPPPQLHYQDFERREDAEREKRLRIYDGQTCCITPIAPPRARRNTYARLPGHNWPVQHRALFS